VLTLEAARGFLYQSRGAIMRARNDPEHLRTYSGFLKATVALIVGVALLLLFMLFYLVP
jgi:hypothetical protein